MGTGCFWQARGRTGLVLQDKTPQESEPHQREEAEQLLCSETHYAELLFHRDNENLI